MKRQKLSIGLLLGGFVLTLGAFLIPSNKNVEEAKGYSATSVPTSNINLNDSSASVIRNYYSSLNNKSQSELQGTNLLKNLKTILKNNQKYFSYDSGSSVWKMYEITDRDWNKSPASQISGYNSSTNTISSYTYGTSTSSKGTNPYIHALYHNRNVDNQARAWDSHGDRDNAWTIEREHVWPKSQGFEEPGAGGARGDPFELQAADGTSNGMHSNLFYGYVNKTKTYKDAGSTHSNCSGNLTGTSLNLGNSTVFEPQDSDKGDIARAIFYMVARYNYLSKSDSDGIDSNNPNLTLVQDDKYSSSYTSSTSNAGKMGLLTDLLAWHKADPVDQYEIHRNNLIYNNFSKNRNPFIDFPEWADFIWGSPVYNGRTKVSYSSTPTGYAQPSTDTINGYNGGEGETIAVTGVSLNTNALEVQEGKSGNLVETISPANATNQSVTWSSSNTSVATVSNGVVQGISQGTATITVTTEDGGKTATCTVTVTAKSDTDTGSATINYNDSFDPALPSASSSINENPTAHTDSTSNFDFKEAGIYKGTSNSYLMFASNKGYLFNTTDLGTIDSVSVKYTSTTSETGKIGVYFGSAEQSTYTTTNNQTIKGRSQTDEFTNTVEGNGFFQISTSNKNVQITKIDIAYHSSSTPDVKTLSSIAVKTAPTKLTYTVGDDFNPSGLVITATYSDDSTEDITYSDHEDEFEFDPVSNLQTSDTTVTISYGGKTCTQNISVAQAKSLTSITLNTDNVVKSFYVDDEFNHDNLVVTAHYSDSSSEVVSSLATVSAPDLSTAGDKTVTVSYEGKTATYEISVVERSDKITATFVVADYAADNSWANGTRYLTANIDTNLTATIVDGGSNSGKYYTAGNEWRIYQTENPTLDISIEGDYVIDTITITYNISNTGILLDSSSNTVESGSEQTINASGATYTIGNSGSATNGQVKVTSITVIYHSTSTAPITGIIASSNRTFYVGETITKSDISVQGDNGVVINDFSFANEGYMFTYSDAQGGGLDTNKTFANAITYESFTASLTVKVQRKAYETPASSTPLEHTGSEFKTAGIKSSYTENQSVTVDGVNFIVNGYIYNSKLSLSSSQTSAPGSVYNTSKYSAGIVNVTVSGASPDIQLSIDGSNWVDLASADTSSNNYYFVKLFYKETARTSYVNITSFSVTLKGDETANNVANYIMYEDTTNQCVTKFDVSKSYFESMSKNERSTFMTSEDYVISTARTRLIDWAKNQGKLINYADGDYVVTTARNPLQIINDLSSPTFFIVAIALVGLSALGGYLYIRRYKQK